MRLYFILIPLLLSATTLLGQDASDIISKVLKAQKEIKQISYTLQRIDTFVNGNVWNNSGKAVLEIDIEEPVFGFRFHAKRSDIESESIFDGRMTFELNNTTRQYSSQSDPGKLSWILGSPGGQMIFTPLVRLDTSGVRRFEIISHDKLWKLILSYPDNPATSVANRYKVLMIDKKTMLPVEMIDHLVYLGDKQVHHFIVKDMKINGPSTAYNFSDPGFLTGYTQETRHTNDGLLKLVGKSFPPFNLNNFENAVLGSNDFKGKVVLLDFWEVWCSPCVASMPKIQKLYDQYNAKGLLVYGIINEPNSLAAAKRLIQKKAISFPMLVGNEKLKTDYSLNAVPMYVLIDKEGKVVLAQEGYNNELEKAVEKAVSEVN